ncbi:hypothetical protein JaAD80_28230 [Janthinobacterium sp. AD80]|nr:hypothetical protein JaAD80_28230 [Janthinobacterium sp. AD80]
MGVAACVVEQGQHDLPDARRVAADGMVGQVQLQGEAGRGHLRRQQAAHFLDFQCQVGPRHAQLHVAAVGQAQGAQVLDQAAQVFHLRQQAGKRHFLGLEDAVDDTLQGAAQDGHGRAQLVRDGRVPRLAFLGRALQAFGHAVEVIDQHGCLAQAAVAGEGARGQVAVGHAAHAVHHGIDRLENARGQLDGEERGQQQAENGDGEDPQPLDGAGRPVVRLGQHAGIDLEGDGKKHPGSDPDDQDAADHQHGHRQDDLPVQARETHQSLSRR